MSSRAYVRAMLFTLIGASACVDSDTDDGELAEAAQAIGGSQANYGGPSSTTAIRSHVWAPSVESGVLIRSDMVLAIGWQLDAQPATAADTYVQFEDAPATEVHGYQVDHIQIVPGYEPLAVLYLDCSIRSTVATPTPLLSGGKDLVKAQTWRVSGYGGPSWPGTFPPVRHVAFAPAGTSHLPSLDTWAIAAGAQITYGGGDQGGGLYIMLNGATYLGGLIAYAGNSTQSIGGVRLDTRLAQLNPLLANTPHAPLCPP